MWSERLKTKALAHLEMARPYTLFHASLVAIAAMELASGGRASVGHTALTALVVTCGWVAGLYAGDFYDRDLDARSKPFRPLPSGRVSPLEAFATMVGLIAVGCLGSLLLGPANLILAVFTTALGISYSRTFKSRALLGNFDRGVMGVCAVLFGALAGGSVRALAAPAVLLLASLVFFHDSSTNLVGAIRDVEGDRAAGCQTVPVAYGLERAVDIAAGLAVGWLAIGSVLLALLRPRPLALVLVAAAAAVDLRVYLPLWLARARVTRTQALGAHKYMVVERLLVMSAFIATYVPPAAALSLLAATGTATVGSQLALRDRHERQLITRPSAGVDTGLTGR
jgi:4-hydroxybenzoate polyprenyltransferase/geranylgeranylglycerol-phosphate geranylgeranyltransferase